MISITAANARAQRSRSNEDEDEDHTNHSTQSSHAAKPKRKRGRPGAYSLDARITILKENARRKGTEAGRRYALYRNNMTIQEALDRGLSWSNIRCDAKRGNISVA
jgi:hypothetical protein